MIRDSEKKGFAVPVLVAVVTMVSVGSACPPDDGPPGVTLDIVGPTCVAAPGTTGFSVQARGAARDELTLLWEVEAGSPLGSDELSQEGAFTPEEVAGVRSLAVTAEGHPDSRAVHDVEVRPFDREGSLALVSGVPVGGPRDVSDVWGYVDGEGREYALMGTREGMLVVEIEPDGSLREIDEVPGPTQNDPYYHRDYKTYGTYAYAIGEMTGTNEGVQIVDLSGLPDEVTHARSFLPNDAFPLSHNLHIDTSRGLLYLQRYSGIEIWDLVADPANPTFISALSSGVPVHDMVGQGDRLYVADGSMNTFSIWDVTDPSAPFLRARWSGGGGYAHNIWPSPDGSWVVTTEETPGKPIVFWSVDEDAGEGDDLDAVTRRGDYLATPSGLAHNAHVENGLVYASHYLDGVVVLDPTDLDAPLELGHFDTSPCSAGNTYNGAWGVYPFPGSDLVLGSDIEQGLFALSFQDPR